MATLGRIIIALCLLTGSVWSGNLSNRADTLANRVRFQVRIYGIPDSTIYGFVSMASQKVCEDLPANLKTVTLGFHADSVGVALPADWLAIERVFHSLNDTAWIPTAEMGLNDTPFVQLGGVSGNIKKPAAAYQALRWWHDGKRLYLHPRPAFAALGTIDSVFFVYRASDNWMDAAADTTLVIGKYRDMIVYWAAFLHSASLVNQVKMLAYKTLYIEELALETAKIQK